MFPTTTKEYNIYKRCNVWEKNCFSAWLFTFKCLGGFPCQQYRLIDTTRDATILLWFTPTNSNMLHQLFTNVLSKKKKKSFHKCESRTCHAQSFTPIRRRNRQTKIKIKIPSCFPYNLRTTKPQPVGDATKIGKELLFFGSLALG